MAEFSELTFGYSSKGADQYLEDIKSIAIDDAAKALDNYDAVEAALKAGWEGQAREDFWKKFKEEVSNTKDTLKSLSSTLDSQFEAIGDSVTAHDKSVVGSVFGDGTAQN